MALNITTSVLIKLVSGMFYLFSGLAWKQVLDKGSKNYHYIFYRALATLVVFICIYYIFSFFETDFFENPGLANITATEWATYTGICLFSFWGLYFYTQAIKQGRFSFISSLTVISSCFSFLVSLIFYNEALSISKYAALAAIAIGLSLHQKNALMQLRLSKEVALVLLFGFFWGISFVLYLIPLQKIGVMNFSILLEVCVLASCAGLLLFNEKRVIPHNIGTQSFGLCLIMGLLVAGGSLLGNFSLTQIPVSLNILTGMFFEVLVLLAGIFFYKEKLARKDWAFIVIASLAGFLLLF